MPLTSTATTLALLLLGAQDTARVVIAGDPTAPPSPDAHADADQDGIPNVVEIASDTDPLQADTDQDGVLDGDEDLDRDGRVDLGESDPRVPGLFPGSGPHIPEPLAFDLVRGLGARKGEFEVNNLALIDLRTGDTKWAPEAEWAFADGAALELELPIRNTHVEAVKVAGQWTAPIRERSPRTVHGAQAFFEISTEGATPSGTAVYIVGTRVNRHLSFLGMLGSSSTAASRDHRGSTGLVANGSTFFDLGERATLGVEMNLLATSHVPATLRRGWATPQLDLRLLPQVHVQLGKRVRLQLGVGVESGRKGTAPLAGLRMIVE
jgi:hypothetical protein